MKHATFRMARPVGPLTMSLILFFLLPRGGGRGKNVFVALV